MGSNLEGKTDTEFIRFLREKFGWQVESPSYSKVPEPKPKYVKGTEEWVTRLKNYLLNTYAIIDGFDKDDEARKDFLKKMREQYLDVVVWINQHSRLKGNTLLEAVISMGQIRDKIEKTYPQMYKKLSEIFTPDVHHSTQPHIYNYLGINEKVAVARKVNKAAYKFLYTLSK